MRHFRSHDCCEVWSMLRRSLAPKEFEAIQKMKTAQLIRFMVCSPKNAGVHQSKGILRVDPLSTFWACTPQARSRWTSLILSEIDFGCQACVSAGKHFSFPHLQCCSKPSGQGDKKCRKYVLNAMASILPLVASVSICGLRSARLSRSRWIQQPADRCGKSIHPYQAC
jgi:hypothetical protein